MLTNRSGLKASTWTKKAGTKTRKLKLTSLKSPPKKQCAWQTNGRISTELLTPNKI